MPYIPEPSRRDLFQLPDRFPVNAGELNFVLTAIIDGYFNRQGGRYAQINDVIGALEGAKLEFYRRVAAPYEDRKMAENGDVYTGGAK